MRRKACKMLKVILEMGEPFFPSRFMNNLLYKAEIVCIWFCPEADGWTGWLLKVTHSYSLPHRFTFQKTFYLLNWSKIWLQINGYGNKDITHKTSFKIQSFKIICAYLEQCETSALQFCFVLLNLPYVSQLDILDYSCKT